MMDLYNHSCDMDITGERRGRFNLKPIDKSEVQRMLDSYRHEEIYVHLEMTMGAYAAHSGQAKMTGSTFIRNARIRYTHARIAGSGPYRVGLKMGDGWVYSEGLTHYEQSESERLIMAGLNDEGKLMVALQLSRHPFGQQTEDTQE